MIKSKMAASSAWFLLINVLCLFLITDASGSDLKFNSNTNINVTTTETSLLVNQTTSNHTTTSLVSTSTSIATSTVDEATAVPSTPASSTEKVTSTVMNVTSVTSKEAVTSTTKPTSPVMIVPVPEKFVAVLKQDGSVYLSWKGSTHPNATYQIYMCYGSQGRVSSYIHLESTFRAEETLKLTRLMSHVTGNMTLTFIKFKVRTMYDTTSVSEFTSPAIVALPTSAVKPSYPRVSAGTDKSMWRYVLPVTLLLIAALLTIVGIYAYRQMRFKRRYQQYMRTHYDTDSEAVSVSNDNYEFDDQPHLTFSDYREDRHLVIT